MAANAKKTVSFMVEIVFSYKVERFVIVPSMKINSTNTDRSDKIPSN
jgi:hypothetical protein